jgi:hypothetical protein
MTRFNLGWILAKFKSLFDNRSAVRLMLLLSGALAGVWPAVGSANDFCPNIYKGGAFRLNFNPAFTQIASYKQPNGSSYDGLVVSSFFNVIKNPTGFGTVGYFERDLVARITGIGFRSPLWFNATRDTEILTDLSLASPVKPSAPGQTVWPNEAQKVPDGIVPFEAIVVPQGFHPAPQPGRLTLINLDTPGRTSYIVDQSLQRPTGGQCRFPNDPLYDPGNKPRFYHLAKWFDMDGDGIKDLVTVRSGFKVSVLFCLPAVGEVVWFKNPGAAISPTVEWEEHVIAGYPTSTFASDITLDIYDFENDGVPEIIGTNFFTGNLISLYGAPVGQTWATVDTTTNLARIAQISSNQGSPFGLQVVDVNRDGRMDILATNHQTDNCANTDPISGKVYALEQPVGGDIFNQPWTARILKNNIRPNATFPTPASAPGRLAPGLAQPFWPTPLDEATGKPWILVGGDEAGKVWLLKPNSQSSTDWGYSSAVIFDINDHYGPNTTQTLSAPPPSTGEVISTIGTPSWRYDRGWAWGSYAEIYVPVFEGRDIIRINFRPGTVANKITCPADGSIACPVL